MLIDFYINQSGFLMKYAFCLLPLFIIPDTIAAMDRDQKQKLKKKNQHSQQVWANPKDVNHGIYLAEVLNKPRAPMRISELDFALVETSEELKAEIEDENNINPLLVTLVKKFKSNKIDLSYQPTQNTEVACLKVEHLLHPDIYKILTIVRTYENNKCTIEVLNDSEIIDTAAFTNYLQLPKIVTRARITLNDEDLNNIEVATNTFSCH